MAVPLLLPYYEPLFSPRCRRPRGDQGPGEADGAAASADGEAALGATAYDGHADSCWLCDSEPHSVGCPYHPEYDDERICYARHATEEIGPASFWVEQIFAQSLWSAASAHDRLLRRSIRAFRAALKRGELKRL